MAVEMDHAQRRVLGQGTQDRQRAQMVPPGGQGHDALRLHTGIEGLHPRHRIHQVARIGGHIPQIGATHQIERTHTGDAILCPDHRRQITHLARTVARTGTVRGAPVPGRADQANLHLGDARIVQPHMRQAHEGRNPGETRQIKARNRPEEIVCHVVPA